VAERKPHGEVYTVVYATIVCLICSLALAAATAGLRPRQDRMAELDRRFNVLKAFGAPVVDAAGRRAPAGEIERLYTEHVRERVISESSGAPVENRRPSDLTDADRAAGLLPVYEWVEEGRVTRYAIPISGKGLWSTIYGFLALDGDLERIIGVTFYKHGETPGLGGEIERDAFTAQFRDRRVVRDRELLPIIVAKGAAAPAERQAEDRIVVDGISGATLTGRGVQEFMNADLRRYAAFIRHRRGG